MDNEDKSPPSYVSAVDVMKLPAEEREAILSAAAESAQADYAPPARRGRLLGAMLATRGLQLGGFLWAAAVVALTRWPASRSLLGLSIVEPHLAWVVVFGLACLWLLVGASIAACHR